MKIPRIFFALPYVSIGLRPHYWSEEAPGAKQWPQFFDKTVTTVNFDKAEGKLPDIPFNPDSVVRNFRDLTSMDESTRGIPNIFANEISVKRFMKQFPRLDIPKPDIEKLRSAVLDRVPVSIYKNLSKITSEIRKAVQESQSEYALVMLYHEMRDESKSESELKERLEFFRWRSEDLRIFSRKAPKDLDQDERFAEMVNQLLYRDFGFVLQAGYIADLWKVMDNAKLGSVTTDRLPLLFALAHKICESRYKEDQYIPLPKIDISDKPLSLTDSGEYKVDIAMPFNSSYIPSPEIAEIPQSRDTTQLSDQIREAHWETARWSGRDKVVLSGIHLFAYILLPNRKTEFLNFSKDARTLESENELRNHTIVNGQVIVHPIEMLELLWLLRGIGVEYDDLERLIEDVLIEPNSDFQTPRYAFPVKTRNFSLKSVLSISDIDPLLVLLKNPVDLAKEVLATYQKNIPENLWPAIANLFKEKDIAQAKGKRDEYFTDSKTGEVNAAKFLSFLLKKMGRKSLKERLGLWLEPVLGKNPFPEKRWKVGLISSILVSLTLFKKYGFAKSREILSLKGNINNLSPDDQAAAVLDLERFFYSEFAEVVKEESAFLPSQRLATSMRGEIESGKPLWELLFHKTVWPHLKYLRETADALDTIIGPEVEVEFLAARTKLDAFIGFFAGLSIRSTEVIRHILSDPKLHTVRILVNKKYRGGMMIYEATVKGEAALIVAGINAKDYFDPQKFTDHLMIFLKKEAEFRKCRYILLPQYPSNQSHDATLRQELVSRTGGITVRTDQEVRFPRQGPGNDPKKDFYGNGHEHNPFLVLEDLKKKL